MRPVVRLGFAAIVVLLAHAARGDEMSLEIIPLTHRLTQDVIPVIQPLVAPGGTVTGMSDKLIVRTTPDNLLEIRQVLASIDRPLRRLKISVRQDVAASVSGHEHGLSGAYRSDNVTIESPDGRGAHDGLIISGQGEDAEVRYRTLSTSGETDEKNLHFVQTVEGRPAFIQAGQSLPYGGQTVILGPAGEVVHEGIEYRDVTSGFYVIPYVNGAQVTLQVTPQLERVGPHGSGAIDIQHAESTVTGPMGAWIALGGVTEDFSDDDSVNLTRTRRRGSELRNIWVKVDEIP